MKNIFLPVFLILFGFSTAHGSDDSPHKGSRIKLHPKVRTALSIAGYIAGATTLKVLQSKPVQLVLPIANRAAQNPKVKALGRGLVRIGVVGGGLMLIGKGMDPGTAFPYAHAMAGANIAILGLSSKKNMIKTISRGLLTTTVATASMATMEGVNQLDLSTTLALPANVATGAGAILGTIATGREVTRSIDNNL